MVEIERCANGEFIVRHNGKVAEVTWEEMIGLVISLTIPLKSVIEGNTIGIQRPLTQYLKTPADPILSEVDRNLKAGVIVSTPNLPDVIPHKSLKLIRSGDNLPKEPDEVKQKQSGPYVKKDYTHIEESVFNLLLEKRKPMAASHIGRLLNIHPISIGKAVGNSTRLTRNEYHLIMIRPELLDTREEA
jgi:hypothetical protein